MKFICRLLIASLLLLPFSTQAGMIATGQVTASAVPASRDKLRDFVSRADVQRQMEALGLSPATARDRVDALTDEEVQRIAGSIEAVPAGGMDVLLGLILVAVILAAIVWLNNK